MKIQNNYIFRIIISEFLYFQKKKTHESGMFVGHLGHARPKCGFSMTVRPRTLGSPSRLGLNPNAWTQQSCQPHTPGFVRLVFGLKNLNFFRSTIELQKQTLPHLSKIFHSYAVKFNCKLFFVYATYFINFLYSKRKECKKILSSK